MGMKQKTGSGDASTSAASAINRVLEAEGQARQAVQSCSRDAETMLREARATAKRIVEHADRRISLIHHRTSAALDKTIGELERDQQLKVSQFDSSVVDMKAVTAVVEEIARLLTTGGPDPVTTEHED
jgi:vacuolar-type H+-ATPase subunit H